MMLLSKQQPRPMEFWARLLWVFMGFGAGAPSMAIHHGRNM